MSEQATDFRPLARMGWGGRPASHFRGLVQTDRQNVTGRTVINRGQVGTVVWRSLGATVNMRIAAVTRDADGQPVGGCRVELMSTARDVIVAETVSNAGGNFAFDMPGTGPFYIIAYKVGGTTIAGITVNTLLPVAV
jgi:hypothetical protein